MGPNWLILAKIKCRMLYVYSIKFVFYYCAIVQVSRYVQPTNVIKMMLMMKEPIQMLLSQLTSIYNREVVTFGGLYKNIVYTAHNSN